MLLVFSALLLLFCYGKDVHVSPFGSGSDCSSSAPCLLATALALASDGDEVLLAPGVYSSAFPARVARNLTLHGPGAQLDALHQSRILNVTTATVRIVGIHFANGLAGIGGAMYAQLLFVWCPRFRFSYI